MADTVRFVRVDFRRFKAFERFTLHLRPFNILVGPNNAGKSTILAAFRILSAAMRVANARKPSYVDGPDGQALGHVINLSALSIAEENIFYNYDESSPATVEFHLSNTNKMLLYFPERGDCSLILDTQGTRVMSPAQFRRQYNCPIGFVPILGPVEHNERLFEKEAARLALFTYQASRNFRNIWYHYPERFEDFRSALRETWPGMDILRPKPDFSHPKPLMRMFCPEERIPRELFWAGFGFQVWCQMLTHLIQSKERALFLIDEPDIYLHSEQMVAHRGAPLMAPDIVDPPRFGSTYPRQSCITPPHAHEPRPGSASSGRITTSSLGTVGWVGPLQLSAWLPREWSRPLPVSRSVGRRRRREGVVPASHCGVREPGSHNRSMAYSTRLERSATPRYRYHEALGSRHEKHERTSRGGAGSADE